jgi:hypothetical protein
MPSAIHRSIQRLASLALITMAHAVQADDAVVGSGHAVGCTEAALDAALGQLYPGANIPGGVISFNCGGGPVTIPITAHKSIGFGYGTTIDGGGLVTLDAGNVARHFVVTGAESRVELRNLVLINGRATADNAGSIYVGANVSLHLDNVLLRDNVAGFSGGAILTEAGSGLSLVNSVVLSNDAANGGGIAANGTVVITDSLIANNTATGEGGGLEAYFEEVTLLRTRFENNAAVDGAALLLRGGSAEITASSFSDNAASARGGGIHAYDDANVTLEDSRFERNFADRGGALSLASVDLGVGTGSSSLVGVDIDAQSTMFTDNQARLGGAAYVGGIGLFRAGRVGRLTIDGSQMSGNGAQSGGAVWNQGTFGSFSSSISGNSASQGGALYLAPNFIGPETAPETQTGSTFLIRTRVADNTASAEGGGLYANYAWPESVDAYLLGNRATRGGGMALVVGSGATLENLTLADNSAALEGGGLYVNSMLQPVQVANATLSGNVSDAGCGGNVFTVIDRSTFPTAITRVFLFDVTLAGGAALSGASICATPFTTVSYQRSVIAQASPGACFAGANAVIDSLGNNVLQGFSCPFAGSGDSAIALATSLGLDALAFNDSVAPTHMPRPGSPILDSHACPASPPGRLDQRSYPRGVDADNDGLARCDAGSVERQSTEIPGVPVGLFRDGFE